MTVERPRSMAAQPLQLWRAMKIRVGAWAILVVVGALGACSSGETSGSSAGTAGATHGAGGSTISGAGGSAAGVPSSGGGAGTGIAAGGGGMSGGISGGAGGVAGSAGSVSSGTGGMSVGGASAMAGASGLGGTTNDLGTIVGSPAVAKLLALTKNCTAANKIASDTGKFATDSGATVHVCSLPGAAGTADAGGALYWTADMDIDCDGLMTANCPGPAGPDHDPSYYNQTAFSGPNSTALTSEKDPYVVIPGEIKEIDQQNGGNIVAVIYGDQIEFAVFGDTIEYQPGDANEPIGEASVRTAKGLGIPASPATGGVGSGVTYIAFTGKGTQPKDMEDIAEVQALGKQLLESLLANNP
jgi:hypothetical protein